MTKYTDSWQNFLLANYLRGTFFSDRCFVESHANGLNNYYGTTLRPFVHQLCRHVPVNQPLTTNFWPENILTYIGCVSPQAGVSVDLISTPAEISAARSSRRPSRPTPAPLRQIDSSPLEDSPIRLLSLFDGLDDDDFNFVFQVVSRNSPRCDLCNSTDHLLLKCPELVKVKGDPRRLRRLVTTLRNTMASLEPGSDSRSSTPTRRNPPMRQIDNGDTDDDASIAALDQQSLGGDTDDESKA